MSTGLLVPLSRRFDVLGAEAVSSTIMSALEQSRAGLIMDLGEVHYVSSAWLRVALAAWKKATADGKQVAIIRAEPAVYRIFEISRLHDVFPFFDDESEAIREVWPPA